MNDITKYLNQMREIQNCFLEYIDNEENNIENQNNLIKLFDDYQVRSNKEMIKSNLYLIEKISENHHRFPRFMDKIFQILDYYKEDFTKYFSNNELFNIFQNSKQILLHLIEEKIIIIDEDIVNKIYDYKYKDAMYPEYFYPEIKPFLTSDENDALLPYIPDNLIERRKIGQNDKYICELIQNDKIDDFVSYVNQASISIQNKIINPTKFETNVFLYEKRPTLIEYATFFGSLQIVKYLFLNEVPLTPSLWLYAIHGANPEIIHFLEENHVEPEDQTYSECLIEAVKCHHNMFVNYINDNFIQTQKVTSKKYLTNNLMSYNFEYVQQELIDQKVFYDLCTCDAFYLFKILFVEGKHSVTESEI